MVTCYMIMMSVVKTASMNAMFPPNLQNLLNDILQNLLVCLALCLEFLMHGINLRREVDAPSGCAGNKPCGYGNA